VTFVHICVFSVRLVCVTCVGVSGARLAYAHYLFVLSLCFEGGCFVCVLCPPILWFVWVCACFGCFVYICLVSVRFVRKFCV